MNWGLLMFFLAHSLMAAQPSPPIKQDARSSICSNLVALAGNINLGTGNCSGLTEEQWKTILSIQSLLKDLVASRVSVQDVTTVMNELRSGQLRIEKGIVKLQDNIDETMFRFTPEGWKVTSKGGIVTSLPAETATFEKILAAEDGRRPSEVLELCNAAISRTPQWLYPYAARGNANIKLGNIAVGVAQLEEFLTRSEADPEYNGIRKNVTDYFARVNEDLRRKREGQK